MTASVSSAQPKRHVTHKIQPLVTVTDQIAMPIAANSMPG